MSEAKVKVDLHPYKPRTPQIFWCNQCDGGPVHSEDEKSGKFFQVHGHSYSTASKEYDSHYIGVLFAINLSDGLGPL